MWVKVHNENQRCDLKKNHYLKLLNKNEFQSCKVLSTRKIIQIQIQTNWFYVLLHHYNRFPDDAASNRTMFQLNK